MYLQRLWYRFLRKTPADMEMVSYWTRQESVQAKITKAPDGSTIMPMEGEKYPLNNFPRGHILFGPLSKLKHEIKNQVFNESWRKLEAGEDVTQYIKDTLKTVIPKYYEALKYDAIPFQRMSPPVREIHRAWTKVAPPSTYFLRDAICFILQEDDAYRFRVQWLFGWIGWFKSVKAFDYALKMLNIGEVVGDMKERQVLLRRVLIAALQDPQIKSLFLAFLKELDIKKVRLTKGDKYHFRAKYFKVDLDKFEY